MKNKIVVGLWVLAVAGFGFAVGCSKQTAEPVKGKEPVQLTGTVFIVTEGAQTLRLPLTKVEVVTDEAFRKYCKEADQDLASFQTASAEEHRERLSKWDLEVKRAFASVEAVLKRHAEELPKIREEYAAAAWSIYFDQLASVKCPPVGTGQTDVDGKFKIQVPAAGAFFVKARAKRRVGEKTENYYWVVPVTISAGKEATVDLSNQNLASVDSLSGLIDFRKLAFKNQ